LIGFYPSKGHLQAQKALLFGASIPWTARHRLVGKKASKACITGAPNDRRFFFFLLKPVILALAQREEAQQPSLPFFASRVE